MAVSIGQRVQSMIDHMGKGELELALSDICIAIDITSQKYYGEQHSSASCYKRFLKENIWMILVTGMNAVIADGIKIPFSHKDIKSDNEGYCTFEQIVYHVMRCGLIHGTGEDSKIVWNNHAFLAVDSNGNLNLSPAFIWGLALSVIVCPVNADERVGDLCWISTATFKYLINDLWGKYDSVRKMVESAYAVKFEKKADPEN
jgi:hypothetical protein